MNTPRVENPETFGRVAVLMGGWSAEREVSLVSGEAVLAGLRRRGVDARGVDLDRKALKALLELETAGFDRVWIALHGAGGEDGVVQAVLGLLDIPYTGSGVLASALALDKARCKAVWAAQGIPTPSHRRLTADTDFPAVAADIGLPLFVKPVHEGSSLGMTRVVAAEDLETAYRAAAAYDTAILAERLIEGEEYTAAILDGQVLPLLRIEVTEGFYDYRAKYQSEATRFHCPCGLPEDREVRLAELSLRAFEAVGAAGWGRVDFMIDAEGQPWFLELNTVPGMTSHSLVPMAAAAAGIDFDELVWRILATTLDRREDGDAPA